MAEDIESPSTEPESTSLTRRSRRAVAARATSVTTRPTSERAPKQRTKPAKAPREKAPRRKNGSLRSMAILTVVGGLVAAVAIAPAYGAAAPEEDPKTIQQVAADDAQSLVVASDPTAAELTRSSYSATTAEEIEQKKAQEAAAERARLAAELASSASSGASIDLSMVAPGTGAVRWPMNRFTLGDRTFSRGGAHMGTDMLAPCGDPLFAAAAGTVRVSSESHYGYGVAVTIDHVVNGQQVNTLYGHMTYGSRTVESGQYVEAGQLIGLVGSTGSSTACHLHFETRISGSVVDSYDWLLANAG